MRRDDAHAWAEVLFNQNGWVPFDGTHHPETYVGGRASAGQVSGLKHLFESSVGDDLIRAAVLGPSKLAGSVKDAFGSPLTSALAAIAVGAVLPALVWLVFRMVSGRKPGPRTWPYVQLPGSERLELLRAFRQVEKMLKRGVQPRRPSQTIQEYAREASRLVTGAEAELAWFTEAARSAAYDPNWGKDDTGRQAVQEARARLTSLKLALG